MGSALYVMRPNGKRITRLTGLDPNHGAGEGEDLDLREAGVLAPCAVVVAREVEGVAELDEHVERHHHAERVLPARVVDDVFHRDERAARRKRIVREAHEVLLPIEVPVVQDHAHRDHVRVR